MLIGAIAFVWMLWNLIVGWSIKKAINLLVFIILVLGIIFYWYATNDFILTIVFMIMAVYKLSANNIMIKKCPHCSEENLPKATKCKHCHEFLSEPNNELETEVQAETVETPEIKPGTEYEFARSELVVILLALPIVFLFHPTLSTDKVTAILVLVCNAVAFWQALQMKEKAVAMAKNDVLLAAGKILDDREIEVRNVVKHLLSLSSKELKNFKEEFEIREKNNQET
jgi:ribosomal protein L40E